MSSHYIPKEQFKDFPLLTRLLELHDIPKGLHVMGSIPKITFDNLGRASPRILTIVGSRKCTSYGKRALEHLLSSLDNEEVVIVSGLAIGIDGHAHTTAIKNNLPTVAALSDAVLIVEAEEPSGTLITGRQALELGKDIGAVPGDIFSSNSKGTLTLIRDGAAAITSPDDVRVLLNLPGKEVPPSTQLDTTSEEKTLLELLRGPKDKDVLLEESGFALTDFMMHITTLEMKGYIEETFGEVRKIV